MNMVNYDEPMMNYYTQLPVFKNKDGFKLKLLNS